MATSSSLRRQGTPLGEGVRERLNKAVHREGLKPIALRLGVAANTVTRVMAGLGVYPGTALLIELRLTEWEAENRKGPKASKAPRE